MTAKRNRRFKRSVRNFLACSALALTGIVGAHAAAPDATVRDTANQVLATIASAPDAGTLRQLAERQIVPHFDFLRMTQLAAGRVWAQASAEQQAQMAAEFQKLLVRTYTQALAAAGQSNTKVTVQAARPADAAGESLVRSSVSRPGRGPIAIDYRMAKEGEDWKVVDVIVENISLVSNYRDWFASQASAGGVDSVIRALQAKNRQAAA